MKRISGRQRLLGGALLIVALIGTVDWFAGPGGPTKAQAGPSPADASSARQTQWQDPTEVVVHLLRQDYTSIEMDLDQSQRDLFQPTPLFESAFARAALAELEEATEPGAQTGGASPEADFRTRHQLVGVMIGSTPLAVVDDRLLSLNSDLEGYRLVEVRRDYVVFLQPDTQERITLELQQRPKTP